MTKHPPHVVPIHAPPQYVYAPYECVCQAFHSKQAPEWPWADCMLHLCNADKHEPERLECPAIRWVIFLMGFTARETETAKIL